MNDKVNLRMCICCRGRFDKKQLLRVANTAGGVVVDKTHKAGGRGAYVCSYKCFENSLKKNLLDRAIKCPIPENIINEIKEMWDNGQ